MVMKPFSDSNVGLIGAVLLFVLIGGALLVLGFVVMLLSAIFGGRKKKKHDEDGRNGIKAKCAEKDTSAK